VAFGAFVDIGVHQDGLVHVSQLADRFVRDPNDVVKVGQKVKVTVVSVDLERNRIALTMKSGAPAEKTARQQNAKGGATHRERTKTKPDAAPVVPKSGTIAPNGMRFR
jgi:uncharacterized protein